MWRGTRLYSLLGLLLLLAVAYLNWFPGRGRSAAAPGGLKVPIPWLQPRMSFVARNGTHFVDADTGAPLYVNGWNSYWLLSARSPALAAEMLRRGRSMGLGVCRTWAFSDGGPGALQISPGRFSEPVFQAIVTRRNSYSGIRYCDEPAIFAWELMNEPRCVSNSSGPHLQAWIEEMAAYVKTLDSKHLVTVGTEGFYGPGRTERLDVNPGDWAAWLCSDFIQNSAVKHIDFASVHAYPDSWLPKASMEEKIQYLSNWVDSHLNDSKYILRKPVLFSEVGFVHHAEANGSVDGDALLKVVYDKIYNSAKKLQSGSGALIWQLMVEGMQTYHDDFSIVAGERPSTYKLITEQSCRLERLHGTEGDSGWNCSLPP
ncbi:hypothetical protein PR202_ga17069 [Eleusine coracana subsp. coracana]|uniref:mannan endo-1,4-beta-mannosidase n=1 Tax=Eleusine coracana subsp. coracana TaxID=191504 RepID=A0AAV5CN62_ELECO|nr:hypothetical protein PR202_ga17069 [Eleusine coracana subsp. coracana]